MDWKKNNHGQTDFENTPVNILSELPNESTGVNKRENTFQVSDEDHP